MNQHKPGECGCEDCRPHALARNNYFTGKLMCERDFTDEQWYFREKLRLHDQRLHGTGIVCGLRLRQYPNANCQSQLVLLEPGSAVDCCGHDILVVDQEVYDFAQAPAVKALIQSNDTKPHVLEFCLLWRECPTEEVPILYDECGCDDTQCAPNRILESYAIEVRVDPPTPPAQVGLPRFEWGPSIDIAHAMAVVLDETSSRVFVAAGSGAQTTLYQVGTEHLLTESSCVVGQTALDLALSPDGHTLYVAVASATAGQPPELWVFTPDAGGGIAAGVARKATLGTSGADTAIALAVTSDGRLLAVGTATGNLWLFAAGVPDPSTPSATGALAVALSAPAFSSDGKTAWLGVSGQPTIDAVDLTAATLTATAMAIAVGSADFVALVSSGSGADRLVVLDQATPTLYLVEPSTTTVVASTPLNDTPTGVLISTGGGTAIVTSAKALQAVNLLALANGATGAAGGDFTLAATIGESALAASGRRLYVPFSGDPATPESGAVAVIDLLGMDCADALRGGKCPACEAPDCLVLARVVGWQVGFALQDIQHPPASAAANTAAKVAVIDNSARTVLASTQDIQAALLCVMETATSGTAGPPGPPGSPGPQGPQGPSGLNPNLTGICVISWPHAGNFNPTAAVLISGVASAGAATQLVIGFSANVYCMDLHAQSVQVLVPVTSSTNVDFIAWEQFTVTVTPCNLNAACTIPPPPITTPIGAAVTPITPTTLCNAVCLSAPIKLWDVIRRENIATVRIQVHGDLIRDQNGVAVDGNHLPPWLPGAASPGPYVSKTGDGIAGGLFESWFSMEH
ncbi:MAG TPA: hypothetical protein VGR92_04270 [Steroidobacteraceae bacterium]|nr:hypothetical protein [Steroidobacteraceae bacterium]